MSSSLIASIVSSSSVVKFLISGFPFSIIIIIIIIVVVVVVVVVVSGLDAIFRKSGGGLLLDV